MTLNELKLLSSLQHKKFRKEHRCFLVEGFKSVREVLQSNFTVKQIYTTKEYMVKHTDFLHDACLISEKESERISSFITTPDIFALVEMKPETPFPIGQYKKILLLDGIQNSGNVGTIIRTSDWFGIQCIVCSEDTAELYNPKTIQATMGSFTRVDVYTANLHKFIKAHESTYSFIGACMNGKDIRKYSFPDYSAIILGKESTGISPEIIGLIQQKITVLRGSENQEGKSLPDSLNVSLSAAIICYELMR